MSMASRLRRTALAPVLALMLSGCVSAYVRPDLNLPDRFAHAPATEVAAAGDDRWWRAVNDPVLDAVVDQVLSRNRDLALATLTLRRARLTAGLVRQDQWPTAAGNLTASRSGPVSSYTANLSVGYDLDLWRGLAAASSAAQWAASATAQDREATRIGLVATTCQLYWDIVFTRQQLTTGDANLVAQRRLLDLVTAQRTYGALSTVEVAEADLAVETQATAQSVLAQHLVEDLAALAILAGNGPALVATDAGDLNAMAPP